MLKLMKYEFRKTMFSKMILLVITAAAEIAYLIGVFFEWEKALGIGIAGLVFCALIGITYIGIDSLLVFHKDLNTKQSYMLFLTPRNSYQVLGAKVLENGISIFLAGVFFAVLAAVDATVGILYIGGLKEFLDIVKQVASSISININIAPGELLLGFFTALASWLMMIVTGDLAIVLSATVFAGKKFSGLVSFLLYLLLGWGSGVLLDHLPEVRDANLQLAMIIAGAFVISAVMYGIAGWIMERKLSV
ncbi:MAG: hypothetical protein Q4C59_03240 [Lachnospiraceae bacterium]|nr:hypothetical protein [Lachnospiraceae bacterium]